MKLSFSLMTFIITLFMVHAAFAGTIKDNFDDGTLADFWVTLPDIFEGDATLIEFTDNDEHDGRLNYTLEVGKYKILWIDEPISGDFEVSIEYYGYEPGIHTGSNIEIKLRNADNPGVSTFARLGIESGGSKIMLGGMEDGTWIVNSASGNWSSPDGKARLIKTGDKLTAIVWDGDEELVIASEYTFGYDPVYVFLRTTSWGNAPVPDISLDNFELTGDGVPNIGAAVTAKDKLPDTWASIKTSVQR